MKRKEKAIATVWFEWAVVLTPLVLWCSNRERSLYTYDVYGQLPLACSVMFIFGLPRYPAALMAFLLLASYRTD